MLRSCRILLSVHVKKFGRNAINLIRLIHEISDSHIIEYQTLFVKYFLQKSIFRLTFFKKTCTIIPWNHREVFKLRIHPKEPL